MDEETLDTEPEEDLEDFPLKEEEIAENEDDDTSTDDDDGKEDEDEEKPKKSKKKPIVIASFSGIVIIIALLLGIFFWQGQPVSNPTDSEVAQGVEEQVVIDAFDVPVSIEAPEWTNNSSPFIVHVVGTTVDGIKVDFYTAFFADAQKPGFSKQDETISLTEGSYKFTWISAVNKDGAIYKTYIVNNDEKTITISETTKIEKVFIPIPADEVKPEELEQISKEVAKALQNGDASLSGANGEKVQKIVSENILNNPNVDENVKDAVEEVKDTTVSDEPTDTGTSQGTNQGSSGTNPGSGSGGSGGSGTGGSGSGSNPGSGGSTTPPGGSGGGSTPGGGSGGSGGTTPPPAAHVCNFNIPVYKTIETAPAGVNYINHPGGQIQSNGSACTGCGLTYYDHLCGGPGTANALIDAHHSEARDNYIKYGTPTQCVGKAGRSMLIPDPNNPPWTEAVPYPPTYGEVIDYYKCSCGKRQ